MSQSKHVLKINNFQEPREEMKGRGESWNFISLKEGLSFIASGEVQAFLPREGLHSFQHCKEGFWTCINLIPIQPSTHPPKFFEKLPRFGGLLLFVNRVWDFTKIDVKEKGVYFFTKRINKQEGDVWFAVWKSDNFDTVNRK